MRFGWHLFQFLAALMLLAGICVPSQAWANPSHAHHMAGMVHTASDSALKSATNETTVEASDRGIGAKPAAKNAIKIAIKTAPGMAAKPAALQPQSLRQSDPSAFDGCGMMSCDCSMACHGSALVPYSLSVPLATIGTPSLSRSDSLFSGLAPEALPKPPKALA